MPAAWDSEVDEAGIVTTPTLAQVKYKNGITVHVEPTVAQFIDQNTANPLESRIIPAVISFVETLPHVHYEAVGFNFHGLFEELNPESNLKSRFLKAGPWDISEHPVKTVGLNLAYAVSDGILNLTMDPVIAKRHDDPAQSEKKGILFKANFHRDCSGSVQVVESIKSFLNKIPDDWKFYNTIIKDILGS